MMYLWFLIGSISYILAMYIIFRNEPDVFEALRKDDVYAIIGSTIVAGIFGPLFTVLVTYWFWDAWASSLPVDEDDKREFPWRK